jgi:hypothetical protein
VEHSNFAADAHCWVKDSPHNVIHLLFCSTQMANQHQLLFLDELILAGHESMCFHGFLFAIMQLVREPFAAFVGYCNLIAHLFDGPAKDLLVL